MNKSLHVFWVLHLLEFTELVMPFDANKKNLFGIDIEGKLQSFDTHTNTQQIGKNRSMNRSTGVYTHTIGLRSTQIKVKTSTEQPIRRFEQQVCRCARGGLQGKRNEVQRLHSDSLWKLKAGTERSMRQQVQNTGKQSKCLLCTSITATEIAGAIEQISQAVAEQADIIEIRLDYLKSEDVEANVDKLVRASQVPCIVTYRPIWEGGQFEGEEAFRLEQLSKAAAAGAQYIDLELKCGPEVITSFKEKHSKSTKVIVSNHNYDCTPGWEDLNNLADSIWNCGADIVKIATTANSISDSFRMLDLVAAQEMKGPVIALAMGEAGVSSRLLAPKYGGFLTFGALEPGKESAPGQPALREMLQVYDIKRQDENTKVFGVIGSPIRHSMSPLIHNAAFQDQGLNAIYLPFLVENVEDFVNTFKKFNMDGCSVTLPHKQSIMPFCDSIEEVAQNIGAINTIVKSPEGMLRASNTDWIAAITAIEQKLGGGKSLIDKKVVILGSGGTARALAFGAMNRGASVIIANRTVEKAQKLALELGAEARSLKDVEAGKVKGDVLINTTSVGMSPNVDHSPIPQEAVKNFNLVFDAVYNPLMTKLLKFAESENKLVVSGVEMFVGQAAMQFEIFAECTAPKGMMMNKVLKRLA